MVFTVSSKAQSSWLFEVTATLKAQSSKALYLQCSEHGIHEVTSSGFLGSSGSSKQTGDSQGPFVGLVEQSMVFTVFSKSWRRLSSKAWYLQCLTRLIRRLSRAKHGIYCV